MNASLATARLTARSVATRAVTRATRSDANSRESANAQLEPSVAHAAETSAPWPTPPKSTPDESASRNVSGSRQSTFATTHASAKNAYSKPPSAEHVATNASSFAFT